MTVKVLIVDARPERSREVEQALHEAGFDVVTRVDEHDDLYAIMTREVPDAVIIVRELMVLAIIMPLAAATTQRAHISVEFLTNMLPPKVVEDFVVTDVDRTMVGDRGFDCHHDDVTRLQSHIHNSKALSLDIVDIEVEPVIPPHVGTSIIRQLKIIDVTVEIADKPITVSRPMLERSSKKVIILHHCILTVGNSGGIYIRAGTTKKGPSEGVRSSS